MIASALAPARPAALARVALDDGRQALGYDELESLVAEEGEWLAGCGERFAIVADNGVGWAIADLALHRRPLPCVPLPGFFTSPRRSYTRSTMPASIAC